MDLALLHGAGNAFAVATTRELGGRGPAAVAREVCAARGLDGLLEVRPREADGDVRMVVWNADGSRPETCGNGLRCVALFARERGLVAGDRMKVETDCGTREVELLRAAGRVVRARAGLGPGRVLERAARLPLEGQGEVVAVLVDVGNPHCVVFVDAAGLARLGTLGPLLARHARFPAGANVELALAPSEPVPCERALPIRARVWERGVGETAACGTGAAAVAVAAAETGRGTWPLAVALPGGLLEIDCDGRGELWLTGPVAHGTGAERAPAETT